MRYVVFFTLFCSATFIDAALLCSAQALPKPLPNHGTAESPDSRAMIGKGTPILTIDRVIATIDGEPYTMSDLEEYMSRKKGAGAEEGDLKKFLNEMLVEQMIEKEAKTLGITVSDEDVNGYVEEIKRQNGVDDRALLELLQKQGLTLESYRNAVRGDILRTKVVSMSIRGKINVVDEDIARHIESHPELIADKNSVHVEQILFRFAEGQTEEERQKRREDLESMRAELGSGSNWAKIGKENYLDLGFVVTHDLRPELRDALSGLASGEVSQIVTTDVGFYLLRFQKAEEPGEIDPVLKEKLRQQIYEAKFREKIEQFLREDLEKKYQVEVKI